MNRIKSKPKLKVVEKAFRTFRTNSLYLNFPNGNNISTIWGPGSYTENHNKLRGTVLEAERMDSNDVEIMWTCPDKLSRRIEKKLGDSGNPAGYLDITQWLWVLNQLAKPSVGSRKTKLKAQRVAKTQKVHIKIK